MPETQEIDLRDEIVHANCRELSSLQAEYESSGDSVEQDMIALRLTRERQAQLHCHNSD